MKDGPTMLYATGYVWANGRSYILMFNEALFMKYVEHTLINSNHTWYPTQGYLEVYPQNEMTSRHHLNTHQIHFPRTKYGVQEET